MKIQTFNIVVGGKKCNAKCPYCVSKLTGCRDNLEVEAMLIDTRKFRKSCRLAQMSGATTVLMTGKGEPTLYHKLVTRYLELLKEFNFPLIELQTNGILLRHMSDIALRDWLEAGLNTICLSAASYDSQENEDIFGDDINLWENVDRLHELGFSVRISCVMVDGIVDDVDQLITFMDECREHNVEQFTARPVTNISAEEVKANKGSKKVRQWIAQNQIAGETEEEIEAFFVRSPKSTKLLELAHGAAVYDFEGQNISINTCLTRSVDPDDIRQLIFFPDGHLRYDWVRQGAIIF